MGKTKTKKWIKFRHKIIQRFAKVVLYPIVKIKYGAKIIKNKDKRQRLILANHQTAFDQFFVAYGYKTPIYYLASEDIFSNGFISKLLKYAVNPIPIKKQATDIKAVMTCMKVAKEGGSIAIFPEGNRTFSGTTEYMSIAIVKLVKALKLPLSFFRIEGGYGVQPRWSDKTRKGKMKCNTSKTLEADEYLKMTDEELYEVIKRELFVDERNELNEYRSDKRAEYLERVIYVCPDCGLAEFESRGNIIECQSCKKQVEYTAHCILEGTNCEFPFKNVKQWYEYQKDYVNKLDIAKYFDKPLFTDRADLYLVELYKKKKMVANGLDVRLFSNRLTVGSDEFLFDEISAMSVLGRNKLNVYYKSQVYQLKGDKRFNAVKYVNFYYRYKNYIKGEDDVKFLGL